MSRAQCSATKPCGSTSSPVAETAPKRSAAVSTTTCAGLGSRARTSRDFSASSLAAIRARMSRAACLAFAPHGRGERGDQRRLRAQDRSIVEGLERIGGERRAGRGDVDDEFRRARSGRALGRAEALDDAVVGDAMLGEEAAGEIDVFGRDPHALAALGAIGRGDVVEIGHGAHVDPGLGRRDHDIGVAEAERAQKLEPRLDVGDLLAHQILAGDAEMRRLRRQAGRRSRPTRHRRLRRPAARRSRRDSRARRAPARARARRGRRTPRRPPAIAPWRGPRGRTGPRRHCRAAISALPRSRAGRD